MAGGVLDPQLRVTLDGKDALRDIGFEENYAIDEKVENFVRLSTLIGTKSINQTFSGNPVHCIVLNSLIPDAEFIVTFVKTGGNVVIRFHKVFVFFPSQAFLSDLTNIQVATSSVNEVVLRTLMFNLLPEI